MTFSCLCPCLVLVCVFVFVLSCPSPQPFPPFHQTLSLRIAYRVISMVVGRPSLLRDIRRAGHKSHKFHVRACLLHHALRRRPPFIYKALALHNAIVLQTCETTRYLLRSTYRVTSANEFVFSLSSISAREFLALFRLTRVQYDVLLQSISQHPALLSQQSLRKKKFLLHINCLFT
jgi:hypothetical protein